MKAWVAADRKMKLTTDPKSRGLHPRADQQESEETAELINADYTTRYADPLSQAGSK